MRKYIFLILFFFGARLVYGQSAGGTTTISSFPYVEYFANGTGPANLIDNIRVSGNPTLGTKENLLEKA